MVITPTQMPLEFKDKQYSGVYSVSGNLVIARIPGINSRSAEIPADSADRDQAAQACAAQLLNSILEEAEALGSLPPG